MLIRDFFLFLNAVTQFTEGLDKSFGFLNMIVLRFKRSVIGPFDGPYAFYN